MPTTAAPGHRGQVPLSSTYIEIMKPLAFAPILLSWLAPLCIASTGQFVIGENSLKGHSRFNWKDIDTLLTIDSDYDGTLSSNEMEASRDLLEEFGEMLYTLKQGEDLVPHPRTNVRTNKEGELIFELEFALFNDSREEQLELEFAAASDFPLEHQHAFHVSDASGKVIIDDVSDRSAYRPLFPEVGMAVVDEESEGGDEENPSGKASLPRSSSNGSPTKKNSAWHWFALAGIAGALASTAIKKALTAFKNRR